MRYLQYLQEDYEGIYPGGFGYEKVTVFVNPTRKEMLEVLKECNHDPELRFILDLKNKNLYIWNAWAKVHQPMVEQLKLSGCIYKDEYTFGNAKVVNGKLHGLTNMTYCTSSKKYDWIEPYFDKKAIETLIKAEY